MSDTEVLRAAGPSAPRRGGRVWIAVVVVLVVVIGAVVVLDVIARNVIATQAAQIVEERLPDGVEGDVEASVGGVSALWQLAAGELTELGLTTSGLTVNGTPIDAEAVVQGMPIRGGGTIDRIDATVSLDEAAVNALLPAEAAPGGFTLGDGTVGYAGTVDVFGLPVAFSATAEPEAAGDRVLLRPVGVELGSGGVAVDAGDLVNRLLGGDPLSICVADRLPEGLEVVGIAVTPERASVDVTAVGLPTDAQALGRTGSCG